MPNLDIDTLLVVLAGVSLFLAVIMLGYGTQRVHAGFGLWTACQALLAAACVLLVDRAHFPEPVAMIAVPGLIVIGSTLRLEGMRRFFGHGRFDARALAIPVVVLALLAVFMFAVDDLPARLMVMTAGMALPAWGMAAILIEQAKERDRSSRLIFGALFILYGLFLVGYGISWLARGEALLLEAVDWGNFFFYIFVMLFELAWVIVLISMTTGRTADSLVAAQKAAESARNQLAALVDFLPDATFAVDIKRQVIAWNRAAEKLTGVSAEEVLGKPLEEGGRVALGDRAEMLIDLVLDPSREATLSDFRVVVRDDDKLSGETELEFPGRPGHTRYLWLAVTGLRDADGVLVGAIESIRDASTREQAERVIRQREEQYRQLFELNLDGILSIAPDGTIQDANPAACQMLGRTVNEVRAAGCEGIIHWDTDAESCLANRTLEGVSNAEFVLVRKDGTTFPAECSSVSYCDALGFPRSFIVFRDITELVEAQRILRESEARLLQAQAASHVGNVEIDLEAHSVWLSPEALSIHGLPTTQSYFALGAMTLADLADDPAPVREALQRVLGEGGSYDLEYRAKRQDDGTLRIVHAKGEAVLDEAGTPTKVIGVVQDITELRQVEKALGLARPTIDHAGDQVFWVDSKGALIFVSDSTCEQLGYTRDELLRMTIFDIDPTLAKFASDKPTERWQLIREGGSLTFEGTHRTKDGRDIPVEVNAYYSEHEGQEYNLVFARDITKRRRMEESLRATPLAAEHAGDAVFWVGPDGHLAFANDSACRQLGYSGDELLNMAIYDLDPLLSKDWRALRDKIRQRGTVKREAVHRTKDGRDIPVELSASSIEHDGHEYSLFFAKDISDRKRAEDTIIETQERARQAMTMEAIGQLAGGIAHDFNNLLTAIMGYGNLILADEEVKGLAVRRDAEEIRSAAERASALTQKILAFSRRQALQPRVIATERLITQVEPRLRDWLGPEIEVVVQSSAGSAYLEVDAVQFEQVFLNLATNARDAMPQGGRFILEARDVEVSEDYCELYPDLQPGDYVLLSLSDTGTGMPPEIMGHIFEPFFTTKQPGLGTGLGLSTVYGIVRQSGGFINVYSEVGKGTTFKIYLPRVDEPSGVGVEVQEVTVARASGGTETVLVVEDEAPLRRLVARVLGGLGYQVFVAGSGPEALELLEDLDEPPDLLLTDVVLPGGMQGNDVAAAFTARLPDLPVLYVSGHARDAIVHSGRLDEGVNFLGKPFTPESLGAKVREVLDTKIR